MRHRIARLSRRRALLTLLVVAGGAGIAACAGRISAQAEHNGQAARAATQVETTGPRVGAMAPDFTLPDQNGVMHHLADLRGKTVILAFYLVDDTPG